MVTAAPPTEESDFSVAAALAEIPVTDERSFTVSAADLDAATALVGMERPTDPAEAKEWLLSLSGGADAPAPVAVPFPYADGLRDPGDFAEFEQAVGFSMLDVSTFVESAEPRTGSFVVVAGPFDDHTLSPRLSPIGDGLVSHRDGEDDNQDILNGDAVSSLGRPVRFAYANRRIAFGRSTARTRAWLEGTGPRLADDPHVRTIGEILDAEGAVSARIVAGHLVTFAGAPAIIQTGFDTAGVGWSVHDGASTITVVWTPTADADAPALADEIDALFRGGTSELYRRTLSAIFRVIDVVVRDGAVVATIQPHTPVDVYVIDGMIASGDTLFIHS